MHSNGHSKEASKAGATAIIGESKLLDLTALFGGKSNGSRVSSSGKNNVTVSTYISRPVPLDTEQLFAKLAEKPANNHQTSVKASTSNEISPQKTNNHHVDLKKLPWNSRLCFSGSYIFYKDVNHPTREYGDSGVQFKCSYPGCFKRLATNVNFIYHVWAHAKTLGLKEPVNGSLHKLTFGVGDIGLPAREKISLQCVECLSEFPSAHKLHEHNFFVHRFGATSLCEQPVCHICEKSVHLQNAEKHADIHGEYEMPFDCPVCGWRSSNRLSLLFHFERNHNAGTTLICPFCLETFIAKRPSAIKSQRTILTSSSFVEHLLEHFQDSTKKANCTKCSLKFFAEDCKILTEKLKIHNEMHRSAAKLKFERKSLSELRVSNPNQRRADAKAMLPVCTDCGYLIKSVEAHYRKKQFCENLNCFFETRCKLAFKQHLAVCPEKEGACSRMAFGKSTLTDNHLMNSLNKERIRLKCSLCPFASKDSALFSEHLIKDCVGAKPLLESPVKPQFPQRKRRSNENNPECSLFALHLDTKRLKTQHVPNFLDKKSDDKANWLSKIVPFISDRNLAVFKKSAIVTSVSVVDGTNETATNGFFETIKFFDEDYDDQDPLKLATKLFPPSRFPQRKM